MVGSIVPTAEAAFPLWTATKLLCVNMQDVNNLPGQILSMTQLLLVV